MRPTPTDRFLINEGFTVWDVGAEEDFFREEIGIVGGDMIRAKIHSPMKSSWHEEQMRELMKDLRKFERVWGLVNLFWSDVDRQLDIMDSRGYSPDQQFAVDISAQLWPNITLVL